MESVEDRIDFIQQIVQITIATIVEFAELVVLLECYRKHTFITYINSGFN